jgi:hypothetical protein
MGQLKAGLELSEKENFWSSWHTKIKALLHKRDSSLYPPDADEVLFFEETEVMDPLLPFSPVGGLYGTESESPVSSENPEENLPTEESNTPVEQDGEEDGEEENLPTEESNTPVEEDGEEDEESEEDEEDEEDEEENLPVEEDGEEDSEEEGEE